jgi:hypothetical protein
MGPMIATAQTRHLMLSPSGIHSRVLSLMAPGIAKLGEPFSQKLAKPPVIPRDGTYDYPLIRNRRAY